MENTKKTTPETIEKTLSISLMGRDEMNLTEFSFALLSNKLSIAQSKKTIEFSTWAKGEVGQPIKRKWIVTSSDKFGLPIAEDEELFIALLELTKEKTDFKDPHVSISRYEICKKLGWFPNKISYRKIEAGCKRLVGVTINITNAFYNPETKTYGNATFHILDNVHFLDEAPGRKAQGQAQLPFSYIKWNEVIQESFERGNIKLLDTELWRGWKHTITKRLHRYLDKKFYHRSEWQEEIIQLAARLSLSEGERRYPSYIKREINKATKEMLARGYLVKAYYHKAGNIEHAVFVKGKVKVLLEPREEQKPRHLDKNQEDLVSQLITKGVSEITAYDLVLNSRQELINKWIKAIGYVQAEDKAAYLVKAIRQNWQVPEKYLKAERQEKQRKEQERIQLDKEKEQEERVREEEGLDKIFYALPEEEQNQLKEQAKQNIINAHPGKSKNSLKYSLSDFSIMIEVREILKRRFIEDDNEVYS